MRQISKSLIAAAGIEDFDVQVASHAHELRGWRAHMARVASDEAADPPIPVALRHAAHPQPAAHPLVAAAIDDDDRPAFEIVDDGPTPSQILAAKKGFLLQAVSAAEHAAKEAVAPTAKRRLFAMREDDILRADAALARRLIAEHQARVEELTTKHAEAMSLYVADIRSAETAHAEAMEHYLADRREEEAAHAVNLEAAKTAAAEAEPGLLTKAAIAIGLKTPPEFVPLPVLASPAPPPVLGELPPPPAPLEMPTPPDVAGELLAARPPEDTRHLEDQHACRERIAAIERAAALAHHDIEDLTIETIGGWKVPDLSQENDK